MRVEATPTSDPLILWLGFMGKRLDAAMQQVDQAYRDAKLAATNVDARARKHIDEPEETIGDPKLNIEPDALHRTHLRAMEVYGAQAGALASSIRDVLLAPSIEIEDRILT